MQDPLEYNICATPENKICHPEPGKWLKKEQKLEKDYGKILKVILVYYLLNMTCSPGY